MNEILRLLNSNTGLRIACFLLIAFPLLLVLAKVVRKGTERRFSLQSAALLHRGILYGGILLIGFTVLNQLGYNLTALLGAAGVAGVAIGFASQTSISNIISGVFLISEKPFVMGDVIQVGSTVGTVVSIDLLSVKLRTFDNKLIRLPNESLIKTEVTTITRYPIRRFDIDISVAYKEDVGRVQEVLLDLADNNPLVLDEPEPIVIFKRFGDSGLEFLFGVWFAKEDFAALRKSLMREIKERFDREGIEIPFPHVSLYAGSQSQPFPVQLIPAQKKGEPLG